MAQISITVNGRDYQVACDDGEEDHLHYLSEYINHRVDDLVATVGQVGEARLLLMASLMIADQLSEAFSELDELKGVSGGTERDGIPVRDSIQAIDALAGRLENIAARIEKH